MHAQINFNFATYTGCRYFKTRAFHYKADLLSYFKLNTPLIITFSNFMCLYKVKFFRYLIS